VAAGEQQGSFLKRFGVVQTCLNVFAVLGPHPNPRPDFRSGLGQQVNFELDLGPVQKSSGLDLSSELDHSITN